MADAADLFPSGGQFSAVNFVSGVILQTYTHATDQGTFVTITPPAGQRVALFYFSVNTTSTSLLFTGCSITFGSRVVVSNKGIKGYNQNPNQFVNGALTVGTNTGFIYSPFLIGEVDEVMTITTTQTSNESLIYAYGYVL